MIRYRTQLALFIALTTTGLCASASASQIQWNVRGVQSAGTPITSIMDAQNLLTGVIASSTDVTASFDVINFNKIPTPSGGKFGNDSAFPGASPGHQHDFAIDATGNVTIPSAGAYTFGASSDDGFALKIGTFSSEFPGMRKAGETYATFIFSQPGTYPVDLVFFQHQIAAELELFATSGSFSAIGQPGSHFELVGDTADGGLSLANPGVGTSVPEPAAIAILLLPFSILLLQRRGLAK